MQAARLLTRQETSLAARWTLGTAKSSGVPRFAAREWHKPCVNRADPLSPVEPGGNLPHTALGMGR